MNKTCCRWIRLIVALGFALCPGIAPAVVADSDVDAAKRDALAILQNAGIKGGLVVHVGCGDGKLTAALRANDRYMVQGLDGDAVKVAAARQYIQSLGAYGQVSVEQWKGRQLPYIDNLVNLIVSEDSAGLEMAEAVRVLAPGGAAYVKTDGQWKKTVKPRPKEIDDWTHYLHDASNNAVSHDTAIGPPRRLQWTCGPNWYRHHDHMASMSAMVSANGRVFYIMDEGSRESIVLPSKWFLIARDAFSGVLLWKRAIEQWNTQLWPLKAGPSQLPRRLVAVGDRVYVTLGIDAPLTALDAATGETLLTYTDTKHTEEILASGEELFLLVAQSPNKWKDYRPQPSFWGNSGLANTEYAWDKVPRTVMAVNAKSGETLWKKTAAASPLTLGIDDEHVFFHDGEKVVGFSRKNGEKLWESESVAAPSAFPTGYGPTLVVQQGVVLISVENKSMMAVSSSDGKTLWKAPKPVGGHASPDDVLVMDGLVWSGAVAKSADSGTLTGRDIRTGEVRNEFPPDSSMPGFGHHRCYRGRATDKYIIFSRTGLEFVDISAKKWDFNNWVRGGCLYGFMPANGMLYVPPNPCGCYMESQIFGFNVLAPKSVSWDLPADSPDGERLERGPLYDEQVTPAGQQGDWPTYRHDAARSGRLKDDVPANLKATWTIAPGVGRLSSPVVAEGKLFVAAIDAHRVLAFNADTGQAAWSYTVGARVDSPPTIWEGRAIFGSTDGWVYCLRAADGGLIWRFRAAPADRLLISHDQLESVWPVSGSVLVQNDTVYCIAGRSAFLDGGLRLLRLDPRTGRKISETVIDDCDPATKKNLQTFGSRVDMPVAMPDILSSDGRSVYMRSQAFDLEGRRRIIVPLKEDGSNTSENADQLAEIGDHLFSRTGFLDDSWFWRSYWILGKKVASGYNSWFKPGHFAPCGRIMVFDESRVYGFGREPKYLCNAPVAKYYLYGAEREIKSESDRRVRKIYQAGHFSTNWTDRKDLPLADHNPCTFNWTLEKLPIRVCAMALAGKTLFAAGLPDIADEEEAFRHPDDPAICKKLDDQDAAIAGRKGGYLLAFSVSDGAKLSSIEIDTIPRFDGMAAAGGKIYMSTIDGRIMCFGADGCKP